MHIKTLATLNFKILFSFIILATLYSCSKNQESEEHELEQQKERNYERNDTTNPEPKQLTTNDDKPKEAIQFSQKRH